MTNRHERRAFMQRVDALRSVAEASKTKRELERWHEANPDKPYPWVYRGRDGVDVPVTELPWNHAARKRA